MMDNSFWEREWEKARSHFPLAASQKASPAKWQEFFDSVSPFYYALWGDQGGIGPKIADFLFSEGLAFPCATILDAGCGPGTVALPLALRDARVTALDYAPGMLRELSARASAAGIETIETVCASFDHFSRSEGFDLVLCCFFPPALCPQGLRRMEELSIGNCAVAVGSLGDQIPFRRELWREIMGFEPPSGAFHPLYAFGFLFSWKRAPNIKHLSWRYNFSRPLEETEEFFTRYFAIFERQGPSVRRRIRRVLKSFERDNMVECEVEARIAILWWKARNGQHEESPLTT